MFIRKIIGESKMKTNNLTGIFTRMYTRTIKMIWVIIFIIGCFFIALIIYSELKIDYYCNIGESEIVGDFNTEPNTFFNNRACAIKDCEAFNNYQNQSGRKELCVV